MSRWLPQSTTDNDSLSEYTYTFGSSSSLDKSTITFVHRPQLMARAGTKLKLIALYGDHECLWNQFHKDYFNLPLKARIWEAIAEEMKVDSPPDYWKHMIYRLRYNVEIEKIQEKAAKHMGQTPAKKLFYADNFHFLNHMFDREKKGPPRDLSLYTPSSAATVEKKSSRVTKPVRDKLKPRISFIRRIAAFEALRNHRHSNLVLSQEAFRKMQRVTSEGAKVYGKPRAKGKQ
ncbi:uncharacterized protein [Drosophila bipectinata]|uniref:uncharacterized protein n=1 Tax=Drosophila bipectinata TaxID=42026 RepID=UPI001C8A06D2|nr:uncharacterized protein LOC108132312 [Drosophila bipectinata]